MQGMWCEPLESHAALLLLHRAAGIPFADLLDAPLHHPRAKGSIREARLHALCREPGKHLHHHVCGARIHPVLQEGAVKTSRQRSCMLLLRLQDTRLERTLFITFVFT